MIRLFLNHSEIEVEFTTFAGGERNVKIKGYNRDAWAIIDLNDDLSDLRPGNRFEIYAHMDNPGSVIDLLLLNDAINRLGRGTGHFVSKNLYLPYLPYARQDRVMVSGESLASSVFAQVVNSCGFNKVIVDDPHSDVSTANLKNVVVYEQWEMAINTLGVDFFKDVVLVAPDAGALKKVTKLAEHLGHAQIGMGTKHRNLLTQEITGTSYSGPDVSGKTVVMVDDICDGGRTFIQLGHVLRAQGATKVILYTTHGIYSYGADVFVGVVDEVYSAYPWVKNLEGRNENNIFKMVDGSREFK